MTHHRNLAIAVLALCLLGGGTLPEAERLPRETDDPAALAALKPLAITFTTDPQGRLNVLGLNDTAKDDDLRHLAGLAALHHLMLNDKITDAGLGHVRKARTLGALSLGRNIADEGLKCLEPLTGLTWLSCDCPHVTDAGLPHLKHLTKLYTLSLRNAAVTDAGLVNLKDLAGLTMLYLSGTQITDAGLEHLKGLVKLTTLDVTDTNVTADGVRRFRQTLHLTRVIGPGSPPDHAITIDVFSARRQRQRSEDDPAAVLALKSVSRTMEMDATGCIDALTLRARTTDNDLKAVAGLAGPARLALQQNAAISDDGLQYMGKLATLTSLWLDDIPINGQGLKYLKNLKHLSDLHLKNTNVNDDALQHLAALPELRTLSLSGTRVTDAGLKHLKGLAELHSLDLDYTDVGDAGLEVLKDLPQLAATSVVGARVTADAVERMQKIRPQWKVRIARRRVERPQTK